MIEISVIIATYNANWKKLKETIDSVLIQKDIQYEIIFADDGSKIKWDEQIADYLSDSCRYLFADLMENQGTVNNLYNALSVSSGEFVKVLSPGDYLTGPTALRMWSDYMKNTGADLSFCNSVYYYRDKKENKRCIVCPASPRNADIYHKADSRKMIFVDYLLANDFILGASVMIKSNVFSTYLKEMSGKVKYAEDYMIRLMVFDNKRIMHINENLIFYEYGEGISTNGNNKWARLLHDDFEASDSIISTRQTLNETIQKKYLKYLSSSIRFRKVLKAALFPTMIWYRFKMKYLCRKTALISNDVFQGEKKEK